MPLRVLQMVGSLGWNGVEAVVMNYYRHIDREKVQFDFVVSSAERQRFDDEVEAMGGKIYRLPSRSRHPFKYQKQLKALLSAHPEYQIFHVHGNSASINMDLAVAKKCKIPVRIGHSHNTSCFVKWQHYLMKPFLNNHCTHRFACSSEAGTWMFSKTEKAELIRNAIDLNKFAFSQTERDKIRGEVCGLNANTPLIGTVGGLTENKNHKFLIDAFAIYKQMDGVGHLMLVGEGNLRKSLQRQIQEKGLSDSVTLYGKAGNVHAFYSAFDIFVLTSLYEGFPVVAIEAQASGLETVLSNKITKEALCTSYAKQLPVTSAEIWAQALLSSEMKRHQREEKLQDFNIRVQAKKLQEFYESCHH